MISTAHWNHCGASGKEAVHISSTKSVISVNSRKKRRSSNSSKVFCLRRSTGVRRM